MSGPERRGPLRPALWPGGVARLARHVFFERRCPVCSTVYPLNAGRPGLCPACLAALPRREKGLCPLCGEAAAWPDLPPALCGRCLHAPPPWSVFVCHGQHEGLLRSLLIQLKFGNQVHLGALLGSLLLCHPSFGALRPDCVVPVPLHGKRLAARGYNQAQLLAKPLARALSRPLKTRLLQRCKETSPQTGSNREARLRNVRNAFFAEPTARGRHVLLVDDTMTTGATMAEAARSLLAAGAETISVAVISRTARHYF